MHLRHVGEKKVNFSMACMRGQQLLTLEELEPKETSDLSFVSPGCCYVMCVNIL